LTFRIIPLAESWLFHQKALFSELLKSAALLFLVLKIAVAISKQPA
jgi:hypothetical protein